MKRINMAIALLQQAQPAEAIVSALSQREAVSRRQAYRYLHLARSNLQPRAAPEPKAVFTLNLPVRLIGQVRNRCRQQQRPISHLVAEVLQEWLERTDAHGSR